MKIDFDKVAEDYQNEQELTEEVKIWNYISVIFENIWYPFDNKRIVKDVNFRKQIYGNATQYTYKTNKNLQEGQILTIRTVDDRISRVLVVNPYLMTEEIKYPVDKIKPIEIVGEVRKDEN